jgi:hypothetical protein
MSMGIRVGDPAFAGGVVLDRSAWRLSRPALVVSVLAHGALLLVAGWWVVEPMERERETAAEFVWLGTVVHTPRRAAESAPAPAVPEEAIPAPPATSPPPRARSARREPQTETPPVGTSPAAPAESAAVPEPAVPSRLDLDNARREAIAAVVDEHARAGKVLSFSLDDVVPPKPAPVQHKPSIFDLRYSPGIGVLSPARARTALGFRMRLWCNRVTGGFGFFGKPVCATPGIRPPTGLFVESIPDYVRMKPECVETRPLAAALGETSPFPTVKCRLVPKEPWE